MAANDKPATSSGGKAESHTSNNWPNGEAQSVRDAADALLKNQKR